MRRALREPMSRPVWLILLSWGMAVLMIAGLLSYWIWHNEQEQEANEAQLRLEQEADEAQLQLEQDRAVCAMIEVFLGPPPPPEGPEGDRGRAIQASMREWGNVLHCSEIQGDNPGPSRDRDHK